MTDEIEVQRENQNLISLAVECKFITFQQEQTILSQLIEKSQENPAYSVVTFFTEQKILSQENIEFLFLLKKHLKIKMQDKKFGELGVANRFVSAKSVENALNLQKTLFSETKQIKKIGDILVENKEITHANKTAILLTQNRIKDDFLAQAMDDLATSAIKKETINMRFGALAVKKGLLSIAQLNTALKIQKTESKSGQKKRYLGEIFQELFDLPKTEITRILKIQKEFEKNRLSLEKALSRFHSEISSNKRYSELFEYTISKDKLEAYIHTKKAYFEKLDIDYFHNWLKLIGIRFGICDKKFIEVFLKNSEVGSKLKIAQGVRSTQSRDEVVEFFFDTEFSINPDNNENASPPFVKKGDVLAKIIPHEFGKPGKDVFGHSIMPRDPKIFFLGCGEGVIKKEFDFLAETDGTPVLFQNRSLFVTPAAQEHPIKKIAGHIKTDTMKTYDACILKMEGNIDYGGQVNCHQLFIAGNVFGNVNATDDIVVNGCIGKEDKTQKQSNYPTQVNAYGNIVVSKNLVNSEIMTLKGIAGLKSDAISCKIYAFQDILLKNVRSTPEHPSILQIGKKYNFKVEAVNRAIEEQTALLRKLQRQDEFDELTFRYQSGVNAQNDYMGKRNILVYLLKICDDANLKQIEHMEQKIQIFEPSSKEDSLLFPNQENSLQYMDEIVGRMKELNPEDQRIYVDETLTKISSMYTAAVSTTEQYSREYQSKYDAIMKKIEEISPEIEEKKKELKTLLIKRDFFLLQEETPFVIVEPVIKVKNIVEKGTIIKGKNASMIVEKSIHGVQIRESKSPLTNGYKIVINGYYD
ncbi:MAG: FapA family protein [Proteobacteria bacterium]|nr:DUF342 domain-containing protein [Desulfobacula sp.]MBU4130916.1 FapA family protein [Pseudomonadota bacterium]